MPKSKWYDAEDPTINNFYKIGNILFLIRSFRCESTEIDRSITYQPQLTVILPGDKYIFSGT